MTNPSAYFAAALRRELSARNQAFARQRKLLHVESCGAVPVVVYQPHENQTRHGNFADKSYAAIVSHALWQKRLGKTHAQARTSLPRGERAWKELDSCNSSDALLMNIFCYPGVAGSASVASLLGVESSLAPEFGFKARVPLTNGQVDRTEVDMRLGDLLLEAKLTESSFQTKELAAVRAYRDFRKVFNATLLPKAGGNFLSYQLIRNVLAAYAHDCSFCVLLDTRRPDLLESWYGVMRASAAAGPAAALQSAHLARIERGLSPGAARIPRPQVRHCAAWIGGVADPRHGDGALTTGSITKTGHNLYISLTTPPGCRSTLCPRRYVGGWVRSTRTSDS